MAFMQQSAKAKLAALFPVEKTRRHRGDAAARACTLADGTIAKLGAIVFDEQDERHAGEIVGIWNSARAQVRWLETGYKSLGGCDGIPLRRLRLFTGE